MRQCRSGSNKARGPDQYEESWNAEAEHVDARRELGGVVSHTALMRRQATGYKSDQNSFVSFLPVARRPSPVVCRLLRIRISHRFELREIYVAEIFLQRVHVDGVAGKVDFESFCNDHLQLAVFAGAIVFLVHRSSA